MKNGLKLQYHKTQCPPPDEAPCATFHLACEKVLPLENRVLRGGRVGCVEMNDHVDFLH